MSNEQKPKTRDSFTNRLGFIMACIGSAVGMANVWAFPYRTAMYGGAAYLIPYLICVIFLWRTGTISETAFGRWAKTGPHGAMKKALTENNKPFKHMGIIPVISSFAIATGYAVIMGWVIRYLVGAITGAVVHTESVGDYFGAICGPLGSVPWHVAALVVTVLMMVGGISKSVEKINKVMIPLFFVLFIIMAAYVVTLPGSGTGYNYLFVPRWEFLAQPRTWVFALGQAFFSLSLAGNGTVIYGSYLGRDVDAVSSARNIAIFDTVAALLAACVVIPAIFAFGMDPASGPPLMFITLPAIFQSMGSFGYIFSIIFFLAIFSAAASSIVNLYETPIEMVQETFKLPRKAAVAIIIISSGLIGLILENADYIGTWMDVMSIYLCPLGALLAAYCFYWVLSKKTAIEEMSLARSTPVSDFIYNLGKYAYCLVAIVVIVLGIALGGIG